MPLGPSSSTELRQSGLATQVEVHDHQQLEIRFNYAIGNEEGPQRYDVDAFFFVPRNVGVNRSNYSREQFYGDVTALMRMDAAGLPLASLADPGCTASPLHRFARTLEEFRTAPRPPPSQPARVQVKLYAYLYTEGVRDEIRRLRERMNVGTITSSQKEAFSAELEAALPRMREALWAYRRLRAAFRPFEEMCHRDFSEAMRSADEYMSLFLEERLAKLAMALDEERRLDGSAFVPRMRLIIAGLAEEEAAYRARNGYLTLSARDLAGGEYFTYRASLLKKAVHQALYLDAREVPADTYVRNAVAAVGAALAAIWALATQIPATLAGLPPRTQMTLFAFGVLAYVLKDRIKETTREYLFQRLKRFDHTLWIHGASLSAMGLGMLRARLREAMRFTTTAEVPSDVVQLRLARRTVRQAETAAEEVIHYRKQLDVGADDEQARLPSGFWMRDILRFNVRHFLVRLDDPLDEVAYFDPSRRRFAGARLPKVYHLNLVLRIARHNAAGEGQARLEHLRLVLDKQGIVRVETVGATAPVSLSTRLKWFPFRRR